MGNILSVSETNSYLKMLISRDEILSNVLISGEISNFKHHFSGHMYFSLKDKRSVIKCVMFSSSNQRLKFVPKEGMDVIVKGSITIYEKSGQYQVLVSSMQNIGEGQLFIQYEKLKKSLNEKGMFDEKHKVSIPFLPNRIGVITSATGSVIKDITNVFERRYPKYDLLLYPSKVQGDGAKEKICEGIKWFNKNKNVDVIILARGGGSIEDLWPFNEESVAYEIFDSVIPIVSAIGHETDYTISDYVSDLRAPTPSAAAELVVPNLSDLYSSIDESMKRLNSSYKNILLHKKQRVIEYSNRKVLKRPEEYINIIQMNLDNIFERLQNSTNSIVSNKEKDFISLTSKMDILSPLKTLERGYGIINDANNSIIKSVNNTKVGNRIVARVKDGTIGCLVEKVEKKYE